MADRIEEKKKRVRSPNYPFINLQEALEKAKAFYDQEDRHQAHIDVASQHWGYKNSAAGGALVVAALMAFGLMEDEGSGPDRRVRLTQMGLRLVLPGSPTRQKDLQVAALNPKIHSELWEKWGASLPSVENMRFYLLSDRGFNRGSVDNFIEEYRNTLTFAGSLNGAKISKTDDDIQVNDLLFGFDVGDYVRWESQGVIQFEAKKVSAIAAKEGYAFVEGSKTGLPIAELTKVDPPAESETTGNGFAALDLMTKGLVGSVKPKPPLPLKPGMNQDVFTLEEGDVTIQWPKALSEASYQDLEDWLELIKRKAKRAVAKSPLEINVMDRATFKDPLE